MVSCTAYSLQATPCSVLTSHKEQEQLHRLREDRYLHSPESFEAKALCLSIP